MSAPFRRAAFSDGGSTLADFAFFGVWLPRADALSDAGVRVSVFVLLPDDALVDGAVPAGVPVMVLLLPVADDPAGAVPGLPATVPGWPVDARTIAGEVPAGAPPAPGAGEALTAGEPAGAAARVAPAGAPPAPGAGLTAGEAAGAAAGVA